MTRASGWCLELGGGGHKRCRVPDVCGCGCPEDAEKVAKQSRIEREFAVLAWDTGGPIKDGPAGASTPVAPGLTDREGIGC